jgi:predicted permease
MWPDIRLALRQMKRQPVYALTCIAELAFGIGACTAGFSALYFVALKPLPYPDPDRLVVVRNRFPNSRLQSMGASPADYASLLQHRELFQDSGAYYFLDLNLSGVDVPRKVNAVAASASLFETLGVKPLLGRGFNDVEQRYRGPRAVILAEEYWQSEFGRDPAILGRSLQLNGELYPVVGVMPKSFAFPNDVTQMWTPMALRNPADSRSYFLRMVARLAPGVDFEQASARISHFSAPAAAQPGWSYFLNPLARDDDGSLRRWMWILFAAVAFFLLIVCSTVAGLVLVRSSERRFDQAVRIALGAGRWRIAREVLTEVLLLAACGGIAGLGIAKIGIALLARYGPGIEPRLETPVFCFALALSLLTGIVCGLYPALRAAGSAATPMGRYQSSGHFWRRGLIVAQVGVATALLVCGGLLIHSLIRLLQTPLGFDPRNVLTMNISLPPVRYAQPESRARFYDALLAQAAAIPGVDAASSCTLLPFGWGENVNTFEIVGKPKPAGDAFADLNTVSTRYFETMRIPLPRGRGFTAQDRLGAPLVVIIDETFARSFFPGEDPVGQLVRMPWGTYTVAGVAGAVKISALDTNPPPTLYFNAAQSTPTDMTISIRSSLPGSAIVSAMERIAVGIDKDQPLYDVAPLQSRIDRTVRTRRFVVWLLLIFAAAGTALAAVGLYGLLAYIVTLRRKEFGIRMALGAGRDTIAMLVCREGMTLVAAGILLGAGAALGAYRFIATQMYGVGIQDRVTWFIVLAVVAGAGMMASVMPAWRVARINLAESLRME